VSNKTWPKLAALALTAAVPFFFLGRLFLTFCARPELVLGTELIKSGQIGGVLLLLLAIGLFSSILPALSPNTTSLALSALLSSSTFLLPLLLEKTVRPAVSLALVATVFLALLFSTTQIAGEIKNYIKVSPTKIFPPNVRRLLFLLALGLSVGFGFQYSQKIQREGFTLPESLVNQALTPVIKILETQLGNQIEQQFGEKFEAQIGTRDQEEILKFLRGELTETLGEGGGGRQQFGLTPENLNLEEIEIGPGGKLDLSKATSGMKENLMKQIGTFIDPYIKFVPIIAALALFAFLQFLGLIATYLVAPLITAVVWLLKKVGFAYLEEEQVTVERLKI